MKCFYIYRTIAYITLLSNGAPVRRVRVERRFEKIWGAISHRIAEWNGQCIGSIRIRLVSCSIKISGWYQEGYSAPWRSVPGRTFLKHKYSEDPNTGHLKPWAHFDSRLHINKAGFKQIHISSWDWPVDQLTYQINILSQKNLCYLAYSNISQTVWNSIG